MKNTILITSLAVAFALSMSAAAQTTPAQQGAPAVTTGAALKAKAASPAPSATAKNQSQKTSIGKGAATATASAPSSYWIEDVDVHDNGNVGTTEFLYDAQRGVVYAYDQDDFTCPNGNPERAGILEAVYAAGNTAGLPVGSGYYIGQPERRTVRCQEGGCLWLPVRFEWQSDRVWRSCGQQRHRRGDCRSGELNLLHSSPHGVAPRSSVISSFPDVGRFSAHFFAISAPRPILSTISIKSRFFNRLQATTKTPFVLK